MMASSRDKSEGGGGGSSTLTITAPPPPGSRPHLPVGGAPHRPPVPGPLSARPLSNGSGSHQSGPRASPVSMSGPSFQKPAPGAASAGSGAYGGAPSDNSADSDKSLKMKIKRTKSGQLKTEDFKSGQQPPHTNGNSESSVTSRPSSPLENGITGKLSVVTNANTVSTPRGVKVGSPYSFMCHQCIKFSSNPNHTVYRHPSGSQLRRNISRRDFFLETSEIKR